MPSSVTAKTKLARKKQLAALFFLFIAFVTCLGAGLFMLPRPKMWTLRTATSDYQLEVAQTDAARTLGLGNRLSMPTDHGMIFVYPRPALTCFWMKDMHFALDILWVDSQKRIVYEAPDVTPKSYPRTYCTPVAAQYVIELYAGQATRSHLVTGSQLSF